VCVASHYAIVQNNSSFMFKYSVFYTPKINRVLTVLVQVSVLDTVMYKIYISIFHYNIGGTKISVSYVLYLGGLGFNLS
jgi:hypothetical protein